MNWLKHNIALVMGVGLPVVLVVFFALASWLPSLLVEPPKYDALFLTNYNAVNLNGLQYQLSGQHLQFTFKGDNHGNFVKLYRFSHTDGKVTEIPIVFPASLPQVGYNNMPPVTNMQVTPISVPEVDNLKVDKKTQAPDGYEFSSSHDFSAPLLFYSSRARSLATLSKNANVVTIPRPPADFSNSVTFVGWVIP